MKAATKIASWNPSTNAWAAIKSGAIPSAASRAAYQTWRLEKMALDHYLENLNRQETTPELEGIVAMHIGEPAHRISSLEDILAKAEDLASLRTLIYYENLWFLDDPTPSARVNAYDWLASRDRAPEGYDPLAPFEERRAALIKALAGLEMGEVP